MKDHVRKHPRKPHFEKPAHLDHHEHDSEQRHKLGLQAEGHDFTIEGKPFKIYSGEMHYFRIHPDYWEHRLGQLAASGLNTG